jgi:dTDP-4-dehydrorhamnose reductase
LYQVWQAAQTLRASGVDMRAVTVWSLLGAYDWNSLLTRNENHYEAGAFDLSGPAPRATELATMIRHLATNTPYEHPILSSLGWWQEPRRLLYPSVSRLDLKGNPAQKEDNPTSQDASFQRRPLLITGATGTLGRAFERICQHRSLDCIMVTRQQMDIADASQIAKVIEEANPWAIINTAGYVRVDEAENDAEACFRENTAGAVNLATACAQHNIPFLTFSSDLVFDGTKEAPYVEEDVVNPLNIYGQSKAQAELQVQQAHPNSLVIRTSAFFGPWDEYNFVTIALRTLRNGGPFLAMDDATISPTYVPDLVNTSLDLLIDGERGIWHLANPGSITWADLTRRVAERAGLPDSLVTGRATSSFGLPAPRPLYSVLSSSRGTLLRPLDAALEAYFEDCEAAHVLAPSTLWQREVAAQALDPRTKSELLSLH